MEKNNEHDNHETVIIPRLNNDPRECTIIRLIKFV